MFFGGGGGGGVGGEREGGLVGVHVWMPCGLVLEAQGCVCVCVCVTASRTVVWALVGGWV